MTSNPPIPDPMWTPARVEISGVTCKPEALMASSVAASARWMKRPIFFSSFFSMNLSGSKFLTSAAIWQANCEASNWVMRATPLWPASRFLHTSSVVRPTPQIRPMPVITTLRPNYFPPFACFPMYSMASFTVAIFSASSSGISISKASSKAITSSTMSSESAPRSSTNEAVLSTWFSSTPNCSTMICFTLCSTDMNPPEMCANSLILATMTVYRNYTSRLAWLVLDLRRSQLARIRSVRSKYIILAAILLAGRAPGAEGDPRLAQALPRVAKEASRFWQLAPAFMARESLKQKALVGPKKRIRIGKAALQPLKPEFKDREILSYYALSSFKAAPEAFHEFRQIISVDGKSVADEKTAGMKFKAILASRDDRAKRALLQDFEKAGLTVAATDFGQLVLLFAKANLDKYEFRIGNSGMVGADRALVLAFQQKEIG